jgi:glycosyltransferase involved in cell wall biosynthesis
VPDGASALPRVAALLPARNAEAFIGETLASLAAQTYAGLQVLISDDASTDRTPAICAAFAAATPRARYLAQEGRLGWIGNVNALLRAADADYVFLALHDDPLEPAYVERLVDALETHPRAVLAFADVEAAGRRWTYTHLEGVGDRFERARRMLTRHGHWWVPYRGLFRAAAARRIGGMRRHVAGEFMADWPWLLQLSLLGEFVRVPEPLVHKVWLKSGLSLGWRHSPWQRLGVALACMGVVRHAGFAWAEELRLHRTVLLSPLARRWWIVRARWSTSAHH